MNPVDPQVYTHMIARNENNGIAHCDAVGIVEGLGPNWSAEIEYCMFGSRNSCSSRATSTRAIGIRSPSRPLIRADGAPREVCNGLRDLRGPSQGPRNSQTVYGCLSGAIVYSANAERIESTASFRVELPQAINAVARIDGRQVQ